MAVGCMVCGFAARARGASGGWPSFVMEMVGPRIWGGKGQPPQQRQGRWHQSGQGARPGAQQGTEREAHQNPGNQLPQDGGKSGRGVKCKPARASCIGLGS